MLTIVYKTKCKFLLGIDRGERDKDLNALYIGGLDGSDMIR